MTDSFERWAREAWATWGLYAKYTHCDECGGFLYCRARRARSRFLCLGCFDISRESELDLRRKVIT